MNFNSSGFFCPFTTQTYVQCMCVFGVAAFLFAVISFLEAIGKRAFFREPGTSPYHLSVQEAASLQRGLYGQRLLFCWCFFPRSIFSVCSFL